MLLLCSLSITAMCARPVKVASFASFHLLKVAVLFFLSVRRSVPDVRKGFAFPMAPSKGKAMPDEGGVAANSKGIATESQRLSAHQAAEPQLAKHGGTALIIIMIKTATAAGSYQQRNVVPACHQTRNGHRATERYGFRDQSRPQSSLRVSDEFQPC